MRRRYKNSFFKENVLNFINCNSKAYILLIIIFFIGFLIGIIAINNTNQESQERISIYIEDFYKNINPEKTINIKEFILPYIKNNAIIIFLLMFLGTTIIGMPLIYLLILFKGYSLGYTVSSFFAIVKSWKEIVTIIIIVLPYAIYIPAMITAAVGGIKLYNNIISNRRKESLKISCIRYIIMGLLLLGTMAIASAVSSFILLWFRLLL